MDKRNEFLKMILGYFDLILWWPVKNDKAYYDYMGHVFNLSAYRS